jgi:hypothetical protein
MVLLFADDWDGIMVLLFADDWDGRVGWDEVVDAQLDNIRDITTNKVIPSWCFIFFMINLLST